MGKISEQYPDDYHEFVEAQHAQFLEMVAAKNEIRSSLEDIATSSMVAALFLVPISLIKPPEYLWPYLPIGLVGAYLAFKCHRLSKQVIFFNRAIKVVAEVAIMPDKRWAAPYSLNRSPYLKGTPTRVTDTLGGEEDTYYIDPEREERLTRRLWHELGQER